MKARLILWFVRLLILQCVAPAMAQCPVAPNQYQPQGNYVMGVAGNQQPKYVPSWIGAITVTAPTKTMTENSDTLQVLDATNNTITITLPASTGGPTQALGHPFCFKAINVNNLITILPKAGDTIDGAASVTMTTLNGTVILESDGTHTWRVISTGGGGGSGVPGGSSGQLQYNNAGAFGGVPAVNGDGTLNTTSGALSVTKTGGVSFAPSATTDTTNASNISSGTIPVARFPQQVDNYATLGSEQINPLFLPKWRRALTSVLRNDPTTRYEALIYGDSTTFGAQVTGNTESTTGVQARMCQLAPNVLSEGFNFFAQTSGYDPRLTLNSPWAPTGATDGFFTPSATANVASYTPGYVFDTIRILGVSPGGGSTCTLNVDGGASLGTINPGAANIPAIQSFTCARGTHTINITNANASIAIYAIEAYDSTHMTIGVTAHGTNGIGAVGLTATGWQAPLSILKGVAPAVTLLNCTINDANNLTNLSTYQTALGTIKTAANLSGDIVFVSGNRTGLENAQSYVDAMAATAAANNCGFIDLWSRWQSYAVSNALGYYNGDGIHPTNIGVVDIATMYVQSLLGPNVPITPFTSTAPGTVPASGGGTTNFLRADGTWAAAGGGSSSVLPSTNDFRLTLSTGVPVTTSNVTAASTMYLSPYKGTHISTYDASTWTDHTSAEISLAVPAFAHRIYDVFAYYTGGALTLTTTPWDSSGQVTGTITAATAALPCVITATNTLSNGDLVFIDGIVGTLGTDSVKGLNGKCAVVSSVSGSAFTLAGMDTTTLTYTSGGTFYKVPTSRTTAITQQDGVYCASGALDHRWVGTICTVASGQAEDSTARRLVFNASNKVGRKLYAADTTTSWSLPSSLSAIRCANNNSTAGVGRVEVVNGLVENFTQFTNAAYTSAGTGNAISNTVVISTDSVVSATAVDTLMQNTLSGGTSIAVVNTPLALGYHFIQRGEVNNTGSSGTVNGAGLGGGQTTCGLSATSAQ